MNVRRTTTKAKANSGPGRVKRNLRKKARPTQNKPSKIRILSSVPRTKSQNSRMPRTGIPGGGSSEALADYIATVVDPSNAVKLGRMPGKFSTRTAITKLQFRGTFLTNATGYYCMYIKPWDITGGGLFLMNAADLGSTGTSTTARTTVRTITEQFPTTTFNNYRVIGASLKTKALSPPGSTSGYIVMANVTDNNDNANSFWSEQVLNEIGTASQFQPYVMGESIYYPKDPSDEVMMESGVFGSQQNQTLSSCGYGVLNNVSNSAATIEYVYTLVIEYTPSITNFLSEVAPSPVDDRAVAAISTLKSIRNDFQVAPAEQSSGWISGITNYLKKLSKKTPYDVFSQVVSDAWDSGIAKDLAKYAITAML